LIGLKKTGSAQNILFLGDTQESLHHSPVFSCKKTVFRRIRQGSNEKKVFFFKEPCFSLAPPFMRTPPDRGADPNPVIDDGFLPKALVNRTPMFILRHPVGAEIQEPITKKGKNDSCPTF